MGFWSRFGRTALAVAPYVAAPFTGGASLAFAPAANAGLQAWNQHEAENRARQGLAPSSYDRWLGIGSNVAGMATGLRGGGGGSRVSNFANNLNRGMTIANMGTQIAGGISDQMAQNNAGRGLSPSSSVVQDAGRANTSGGSTGRIASPRSDSSDSSISSPTINSGIMPRGGFSYRDNPLNQVDQSNPNLALSLHQGRQEAIRNQPFRRGYDVTTTSGSGDNQTTTTSRMPRISPSNQGRRNRQRESA